MCLTHEIAHESPQILSSIFGITLILNFILFIEEFKIVYLPN